METNKTAYNNIYISTPPRHDMLNTAVESKT